MLREKFKDELKNAMLKKDEIAVSTLRLIIASLKDRDIAARSKGNMDGISDSEILSMLQTMIKQRRESVEIYKRGGRSELAKREAEEIQVIEKFLPRQMENSEVEAAIDIAIEKLGAVNLKDMGKIMAHLKDRYSGQIDFAHASKIVKEKLLASSK